MNPATIANPRPEARVGGCGSSEFDGSRHQSVARKSLFVRGVVFGLTRFLRLERSSAYMLKTENMPRTLV